jgi:RNA polymerase subunit RPABC4/transcription elongation factor Spt4
METIIARGAQLLVALGGAYLVALWFVLVVWTFRDIETRSRSVITQVFSTLLVVLFFVPGVLLYLILRPKESMDVAFQRSLEEEYLLQDLEELPLCLSCQRYVEDDFVLCPHCQTQLRETCPSCTRLVDLRWNVCPYCGAEQGRGVDEAAARVLEPAARWISPSVLKRRVLRPAPVPALPDAPRPAAPSVTEPAALVAQADEPAIPAPVRLFDRRKTRETARLNSTYRTGNGNDRGAIAAHANGSGSMAERFAKSAGNGVRELIVSPDGNRPNRSGHEPRQADQPVAASTAQKNGD